MSLEPIPLDVTIRRRADRTLEAFIQHPGSPGPNMLPLRSVRSIFAAKGLITRTLAKMATGVRINWTIEDPRP